MLFPLMFSPFDEAFGFKVRQASVSPENSKPPLREHPVAAKCEGPVTSGCQLYED
jgi:hypothetical protein